MRKLYILLLSLILIYFCINIVYTINNPEEGFTNILNLQEETIDNNTITIGSSAFTRLENFENSSTDNKAVSLIDSQQNVTINVREIDDSQNLSETVDDLLINNKNITSNQTLNETGVIAYYLYEEGRAAYNASIYFNKDGKNYLIRGDNVTYEDSDYFISNCKDIVNSMTKKEESEGFTKG